MSRKPSVDTRLRTMRANYSRLLQEFKVGRDTITRLLKALEAAQAEREEWKCRFDLLLAREPKP